jgi:hypothetical protein
MNVQMRHRLPRCPPVVDADIEAIRAVVAPQLLLRALQELKKTVRLA